MTDLINPNSIIPMYKQVLDIWQQASLGGGSHETIRCQPYYCPDSYQ